MHCSSEGRGTVIQDPDSFWFWASLISRMEKAMAPHSSTLAWKIPWAEEPGRLQSMGSLRVGYDWATSLSLFTFMHWRRKWQPTPVFLPGESQGRRSRWAVVYGVTQSRTWLKRRSSSSSISRSSVLQLKGERKNENTTGRFDGLKECTSILLTFHWPELYQMAALRQGGWGSAVSAIHL